MATGSESQAATRDRASIRGSLCCARSWVGYVLAAAATALAALLRWALIAAFGDMPLFITFFPAVALVAILLGARAAVLATILSVLEVSYFFLPPPGSLRPASLNHAVTLGLFAAAGLLVSGMAALLQRARRREAASRSESLLRAISEGIPDPLFLKDPQSRIIIANAATLRAIGKPADQVIGHTDAEFFDDTAVARAMMANDRQAMESGQPVVIEELVPGPEGMRTFLSIKTPWRDLEGRIIGVIGCSRDITDRKRAEEALRESEARFQVLAAGTFEGIVISEGGRLTDVNEQLARMLGYERDEMIGMEMEAILPPEAPEQVMSNIRAGAESHVEHDLLRKDGSRVAVQAHGRNITYQNRSVRITAIHDISERHFAEQVLRRYELLASGSRDIILFIDRVSGRILEANAAAETAYGYSREELMGLRLDNLRVDKAMTAQLMAEADVQGAMFETEHRRRDGSTFPVEVSSRGATIEGRRALISVIRDITERRRAEEALRKSEARLRAVFEQAAVGTAVADPATGRFLEANPRYCEITGYEPSDLLGMTFMDVTHPEDRLTDREKYDRLVTGQAREYLAEKRYVRKDGRVIWVQVAVGMVRDAQGRAIQSVGVIQDITERRQWQEALQESEEGLAAAQRLAHIGSWEWNIGDDTARWSDETYRIFGVTRGQLAQHRESFLDSIHPEDRRRTDQALSDALSGAKDYDLNYRIRRSDGQERIIHAQAEVLRGSSGEPVIMRGTVHDITERKRAEDQLKELNATLEQRVAERTAEAKYRAGQLQRLAAQLTQVEQQERQQLATLLHDHLQQLLVGAKFHLTTVRNQPLQERYLQSLRQADELIDASLKTSRSLTAELSPPILHEGTLTQVLQWLARSANEKYGLTVPVSVDEEADLRGPEMRFLIFQAVRELLLNVAKHAGVDEASVRLRRKGPDRVQILVTDEGVGFDWTRKAAEAARGEPGSGLGLFSIRERLELMGGSMEIDSRPGEGTRISLTAACPLLASAPPVDTPTGQAVTNGHAAGQAVERKPKDQTAIRILLADDHEVVRTGLARLLQTEPDIEIVGQAADGQAAVAAALQTRPDVILMDVSMPRMSGVEATRRIVQQMPNIKVIGLSMHEQEDVAASMKAAGAAMYLTKTAPPETLVAAIRECTARTAIGQ